MKNLKLIIAFVITFCFAGLSNLNAENAIPLKKDKSEITIENLKNFKEKKRVKTAKLEIFMWAVEKE